MDRWAGRVAVVTGASSGIGAAVARDLVGHGLIVVGMARRDDRIKAMAEELKGSTGKLYAVRADLRKEADIVSAFGWVEANVGAVSILVNNAGYSKITPVINGDMEVWRQMFDVNVFAVGVCTREAIKSMREHHLEDGHIININSVLGHRSTNLIGKEIYASTKHALRIITEGVRRELIESKSKIKITSVSPGAVATELRVTAGDPPFTGPRMMSQEVAHAVLLALSTPPSIQVAELIVTPSGERL